MKLRTTQEARKELEAKGVSISQWAIHNKFSTSLVYAILAGRRKPTRGQSHQIAVKLGIKAGEIVADPGKALS